VLSYPYNPHNLSTDRDYTKALIPYSHDANSKIAEGKCRHRDKTYTEYTHGHDPDAGNAYHTQSHGYRSKRKDPSREKNAYGNNPSGLRSNGNDPNGMPHLTARIIKSHIDRKKRKAKEPMFGFILIRQRGKCLHHSSKKGSKSSRG